MSMQARFASLSHMHFSLHSSYSILKRIEVKAELEAGRNEVGMRQQRTHPIDFFHTYSYFQIQTDKLFKSPGNTSTTFLGKNVLLYSNVCIVYVYIAFA